MVSANLEAKLGAKYRMVIRGFSLVASESFLSSAVGGGPPSGVFGLGSWVEGGGLGFPGTASRKPPEILSWNFSIFNDFLDFPNC